MASNNNNYSLPVGHNPQWPLGYIPQVFIPGISQWPVGYPSQVFMPSAHQPTAPLYPNNNPSQFYVTSSTVLQATTACFQNPQHPTSPDHETLNPPLLTPPSIPKIVQPKKPIPAVAQSSTNNEKAWTQEQINKVMELGKSILIGSEKRWVKIALEVFGPNQSPDELVRNASRCNSKFYYTKSNPSNKTPWDTRLDPKLKEIASQYQPNELGKWKKVSFALFNNITSAIKCKKRYEYLIHKEKEKKKKAQKVSHNTSSQKSDI